MKYNAVWLASLPQRQRDDILGALPLDVRRQINWLWPFWAREDQLPPDGKWVSWLLLGGRGAGKTRAGAEWVRSSVVGKTALGRGQRSRIALIGETISAARDVTDSLQVSVYTTLDASSEVWDVFPFMQFTIKPATINAEYFAFTVMGVRKFRIGGLSTGATNTYTMGGAYMLDGVSA